jgi:hypothetical protein
MDQLSPRRYVPAWQVQTGSYSLYDYVHILTDEIDGMGWPRTQLVHRLTPVDWREQERLSQIKPEWLDA